MREKIRLSLPFDLHYDSEIGEFIFNQLEENQTINFASVLTSVADDFLFWLCNEIENDYGVYIDYELIHAVESGIIAEFKRSELMTLKLKLKANFPYSEVLDPIENYIKSKWDGENIYFDYLDWSGFEFIRNLLDQDKEDEIDDRNEELENWEMSTDDRDPGIMY